MKKILMLLAIVLLGTSLLACNKEKSEVEKIIDQAQNMTLDELMAKAYEESKDATLYGLGNSSRGKTAGETFVAKMKEKYPDYNGVIEWSQPKENSIFEMLTQDTNSASPKFFMTLIQDGSQIQSKMIDTGILLNFIPKEFREAQGVDLKENGNPLALQTLSKVFMYNHGDGQHTFDNVWDFVAQGQRPMFMGLNSEPVGFNFLLMLTQDKYVKVVKEAFDALSAEEKAYFQPKVDALKNKAKDLGLGKDAEYSLAWIQEWVNNMNVKTDDGPISVDLVNKSAAGQTALIVYSKLRSITESAEASVNNVKVAAYESGYVGFGGYAYKHYLQILKNSPHPWTAAAFITYMLTDATGFNPWGKDIGGYSPNPGINLDHSQAGYVDGVNVFPAKNDKGADWWLSMDAGKGRLVVEDPVYASQVAFTVGEWIESLSNFK
ncbi:hypothetical protein [Acholeplasma hippikon]|uniref:Maltose-binding periplasmic proteins/domains n=1 Tax=Acholeplasma hippikon TaxID=264636 RepID=A0A449BJF0_9MOLU|nr:hypothetical protein [Acholeplasma hippikon]VEU82447.1 Uncharacterised protein [Acholeplasma hippikon]